MSKCETIQREKPRKNRTSVSNLIIVIQGAEQSISKTAHHSPHHPSLLSSATSSPFRYSPHIYPASPSFSQSQPFLYIPGATLQPHSPYPSTTPRNDGEPLPERAMRARRPSWPGGQIPPVSPIPGYNPGLAPPEQSASLTRRRSFGNSPYSNQYLGYPPIPVANVPFNYHYQTFESFQNYDHYPPQPQTLQIHPCLSGESPRSYFHFDLSWPEFYPIRWVDPGQVVPLTKEQLQEPATRPPITRLRIICDTILQWPINLVSEPDLQGANQARISIGDILTAIHCSLHLRVTHAEWAKLSVSEETAVSQAYVRRCTRIPSVEKSEASQGVKRVDYLLDKINFRGLVRVPEADGFITMKLIVG
jgi:hypothetical protein